MRKLDPRERRLLELFRRQDTATTAEIARHLKLSPHTVVVLCRLLVKTGFLEMENPARKNRAYRLEKDFDKLLG